MEKRLKVKCEICNENRFIQYCHIINREMDNLLKRFSLEYTGNTISYYDLNLIHLCLNHHKCFDNNRLTDMEISLILPHIKLMIKLYLKLIESMKSNFSGKDMPCKDSMLDTVEDFLSKNKTINRLLKEGIIEKENSITVNTV